jgi:hypothetical protein
MAAYDTFAAAGETGALKVVLSGSQPTGLHTEQATALVSA